MPVITLHSIAVKKLDNPQDLHLYWYCGVKKIRNRRLTFLDADLSNPWYADQEILFIIRKANILKIFVVIPRTRKYTGY